MFTLKTSSPHFPDVRCPWFSLFYDTERMFSQYLALVFIETKSSQFIFNYHMCEREMFYLTTHSTHFIYGYMASDIWLRTILIVRKETRCRHIGYSYRLTARVILYAPSHRQDNTYHCLCYTSRRALAGMRNSSIICVHLPITMWLWSNICT